MINQLQKPVARGRSWSLLLALCLLLAPVALVVPARATSVRPPEFIDLVNGSDFIVRATVKSVRSEFDPAGGRKIFTLVELEVQELIAGAPPAPLVLRFLGGRIGDKEMIVEGVPTFRAGEEGIFFVQGNGRQLCPLVAMMHGIYPVIQNKEGLKIVTRSNKLPLMDAHEVVLPMTTGGVVELQRRLRGSADALTPAEFSSLIKAAVKSDNTRLRER